jgi:hypothetical protein
VASNPLVFGGALPVGPKIGFNGNSLASSTRAFWDGAEVPVEFVSSTRINITPPATDLARWGAHDVYVMNGPYRSATVREFVARSTSGGWSAVDRTRRRMYLTVAVDPISGPINLLVLDLTTGALLKTVTAISSTPVVSFALSGDGHYLYYASAYYGSAYYTDGNPTVKISRYDTDAEAVDLTWSVDLGQSAAGIQFVLLPVPGSPESVIVWNSLQGATIFDRDQPRLSGSLNAGFAAADAPVFATASRIYLAQSDSHCWRWMDYDANGIIGGSPGCSTDLPADAVRDGGFLYLTNGQDTYLVDAPSGAATVGQPTYLVDTHGRRVVQSTNSPISTLITVFDLDSKGQFSIPSLAGGSSGGQVLHLGLDGTAIIVTASWIAVIP